MLLKSFSVKKITLHFMELIIPSPHSSQLTKQKEQTILVSNLGSLVIERFNWARKDFFTKNNTTKMYQIAAKKKVHFISFHKMKFHEFQLIEISWKKLHFMELIGWMTEIIETITSQFSIDKTEGTKKSGVNFGGLCDRTFQRYNSAGEDPKPRRQWTTSHVNSQVAATSGTGT